MDHSAYYMEAERKLRQEIKELKAENAKFRKIITYALAWLEYITTDGDDPVGDARELMQDMTEDFEKAIKH